MTTPAPDARPSSLHRRLTVALTGAADRSQLADALQRALAGSATAATPLRSTDLLAAATSLAALRADERAELRVHLEQAAGRADEARVAASAVLDDLVGRRVRLLADAEWARGAQPELERRRGLVDEARRALDARAHDARSAHALLDRVLEQRAAAAAAVEEADRELGDMTSAGMDEPGLRRELEVAGRSVRDASAALRSAKESLEALEAEQAQVDAELGAARDQLAPAGQPGAVAAELIERVLDAYEAYRDATSRELLAGRPDPAAVELAQAWQDLMADFVEAGVGAAPRPTDDELQAAAAAVAEAEAELRSLEHQLESRVLTPAQRAAIDAAHAAVLEAEERTGRRFGAGAANARLEAARAAERALLDEHGFEGYLEVMLTGGRAGTQNLAMIDAERRYVTALTALEQLQQAATSPTIAYLESERERLRKHTVDLIGVDPGDSAVELLGRHPTVEGRLVHELREALDQVGVRPVGVALLDAAEAWLGEQRAVAEQQLEHDAALEEDTARLAQLEARAEELSGLVTAAERRVAEAAENLDLAQRSVDAFEAELTVRAGQDTKRLKRLAAAEQLRAQVDAVEATLSRAEASARAALDQAMSEQAAAEVAYDQAGTAVTELARRARALAEHLPPEQRPEGDLLDSLAQLAVGIEALVAGMQPELAAAEQALAAATVAHDEAVEAVTIAGRAAEGPQRDDFVKGLAQLLVDGDREVLILDEPFADVDPDARDDLLALVRDGSADRQVVLLTEDPDVLGWAIELPADIGTAMPADALLARIRREPAEAPVDLDDATPATADRRHAGRT